VGVFPTNQLPDDIAFDHKEILDDYFRKRY